MRMSHHATVRQRQRGVSSDAIDFALAFGTIHRQRHGHLVYIVTDRALRAGSPTTPVERLRGLTVVEVDGVIKTVWKSSRVRHRRCRAALPQAA